MSNALAPLEKAVALLQAARTLNEVEKIRAMAAAAEAYARAEKLGDEAIAHANEIKLRAARKAGELLAAMTEKAKGGQPYQKPTGSRTAPVDAPPTLADMSITKKESSRFQAIAAVPEEEFEKALRSEKKPTETKLAKLGRKTKRARPHRRPRVFADWKEAAKREEIAMTLDAVSNLGDPAGIAGLCVRRDDTGRYAESARRAAQWLTAFIDSMVNAGGEAA